MSDRGGGNSGLEFEPISPEEPSFASFTFRLFVAGAPKSTAASMSPNGLEGVSGPAAHSSVNSVIPVRAALNPA